VDSLNKDGAVRNVSPDVMQLRVPDPSGVSRVNAGAATAGSNSRSAMVISGSEGRILTNAFASDQAKIAVLNPGAAAAAARAVTRPAITVAVEKPRLEPAITINYDGAKIFDPRTTVGGADGDAVNNALIIKIPSNIDRTVRFVPTSASSTDPKIRAVLDTKAQIVNLSPSALVAGEMTLSSPALPIRVVTYDPAQITLNPTLANTIKTSSTVTTKTTTTTSVKSTLCATCIKSLSLIRP
jgi:hypothetical protein